jgi:hypothetical protein
MSTFLLFMDKKGIETPYTISQMHIKRCEAVNIGLAGALYIDSPEVKYLPPVPPSSLSRRQH